MPYTLYGDRMCLIQLCKSPRRNITRYQKGAFNIISATCKAFLPVLKNTQFTADATYGYFIGKTVYDENPSRTTVCNMAINNGRPFYWIEKGICYPEDGILPIAITKKVAKDVERGWLIRMLKRLSDQMGNERAFHFAKDLGINFHLIR